MHAVREGKCSTTSGTLLLRRQQGENRFPSVKIFITIHQPKGRFTPTFLFQKYPKFQVLGTCTQAFLQMFFEYLERSRTRKIATGSFQILEPISTFPKYPCEGRYG